MWSSNVFPAQTRFLSQLLSHRLCTRSLCCMRSSERTGQRPAVFKVPNCRCVVFSLWLTWPKSIQIHPILLVILIWAKGKCTWAAAECVAFWTKKWMVWGGPVAGRCLPRLFHQRHSTGTGHTSLPPVDDPWEAWFSIGFFFLSICWTLILGGWYYATICHTQSTPLRWAQRSKTWPITNASAIVMQFHCSGFI